MILRICVVFTKLSKSHFSTSLKQALATSSFCNLASLISGLPLCFSWGQSHFCHMPLCLHDLQQSCYALGGWLKAQLGGGLVFPELEHSASAQCYAPTQHCTSTSCGFGKITEKNSSGERNVFSHPSWWVFLSQTFCFWLAVPGSFPRQQ